MMCLGMRFAGDANWSIVYHNMPMYFRSRNILCDRGMASYYADILHGGFIHRNSHGYRILIDREYKN